MHLFFDFLLLIYISKSPHISPIQNITPCRSVSYRNSEKWCLKHPPFSPLPWMVATQSNPTSCLITWLPRSVCPPQTTYFFVLMSDCSFKKQHKSTVLFRNLSVQFSRSVVSDSLRPHESQHATPPCPSFGGPQMPTKWSVNSHLPPYSPNCMSLLTLLTPTTVFQLIFVVASPFFANKILHAIQMIESR